jgi:hypothetical protein
MLIQAVSTCFRGTGTTIPALCFTNQTARSEALASVPELVSGSGFESSAEAAWQANSKIAAVCAESPALIDAGTLIGTSYTARDMLKIVEALGEDGLLRYYGEWCHPRFIRLKLKLSILTLRLHVLTSASSKIGASYGTALGQIFAAMFPDKVDKMVLDGVLNPHEYIAGV